MGTTLEQIITGLYEVIGGMASYDFAIIDADVLGAVYEQYLGHVAQVVKQRAKEAQAKLDLGIQTESITLTGKKERRKEHGIYYTPKFVTDYIVKETVGRFLKERSHNEIRNIKILDPACGSGSFLIRAFDELLKHYANQRISKSEADIDAADRISILTSNIFGVDLDIQAVEIARLNLLLRSLARRETLPSLKDNIRQGNSLISGTEEELKKYFGDSWREKKAFNWEQEFPQAFNSDRKPKTLTITIDTNAINVKQRIEELNLLEKYERWGLVQIFKTDALDTELLADETSWGQNRRDKASNLPEDIGIGVIDHSRVGHARVAGEEDVKLQDEIINVLFQKTRHQLTTQQLRDAMHLHTHVMHHRDFFVTRDKHILSRKEELHKKFGINTGTPEECLQFIKGFLPKGFDVVIGNPPYVQVSMDTKLEPGLKEYLIAAFGSSMGRLNTFGFFIHRGISLLKQGGFLGFIIPNTFLTQEYYRELREFVLDTCQIVAIATLEEMPFEAAVVENVVVVLRRENSAKAREQNEVLVTELGKGKEHRIPQSVFKETFNYSFAVHLSTKLKTFREKIDAQSTKLGGLVNVNQAIALKHDRKSCLFKEPWDNRCKKVLDGRDIARYAIYFPGNYLLYDILKIHSCKREDIFLAGEKILFRRVGDRIVATLDTEQYYALNTLVVVTPKVKEVNLKFVLAIMNSTLLNSYYSLFLKSTKKVFSEIQARQIEQLPIRRIDFDNPTHKKMHDDLVALADRMLELNKRLVPIRNTPCDKQEELLREIKRTDAEIDQKVYELYGLTEEEKQVIETSL